MRIGKPPFGLWRKYPGFRRLQFTIKMSKGKTFTPMGYMRTLDRSPQQHASRSMVRFIRAFCDFALNRNSSQRAAANSRRVRMRTGSTIHWEPRISSHLPLGVRELRPCGAAGGPKTVPVGTKWVGVVGKRCVPLKGPCETPIQYRTRIWAGFPFRAESRRLLAAALPSHPRKTRRSVRNS
jgi:hypothetical protein